LGEISPTAPAALIRFQAAADGDLSLEARSLSADFAPILLVYTAQGELLGRQANPLALASVTLSFTAQAGQSYQAQVLGVGGGTGQFILSLQTGAPSLPPMVELRPGLSLEASLTPGRPQQSYQIPADPALTLTLQVESRLGAGSVSLLLSDAEGMPLGLAKNALGGAVFYLPPARDETYILTVFHSGAEREEGFRVSLQAGATALSPAGPAPTVGPGNAQTTPPPAQTPAPTAANAQVVIPFDGPCAVTSLDNLGVNVRRGPGTAYEVVSGLVAGQILTVTGRDAASNWWQVEYTKGIYGWVSAAAVRRGGDCTGVGLASFPAAPEAAPTAIATESLDPSPTPTP
jgi:hypothetical protein